MAGTSYSSDNRIKGLFAENGYNREGDTSLPPRAVQPVLLTQLGQAPQYLGHADFVSQQPFDVPHVTWDGDEQLAVEEVFRFDFTHDIPPQHSGDGGFEY